jgi:hypothetical protein
VNIPRCGCYRNSPHLEQVTPGEASAGYQDHERSMARLGGSGSSGHYAWAVNGVATPGPYRCRSAASHGVSIVSLKLFPSMFT